MATGRGGVLHLLRDLLLEDAPLRFTISYETGLLEPMYAIRHYVSEEAKDRYNCKYNLQLPRDPKRRQCLTLPPNPNRGESPNFSHPGGALTRRTQ